jgi:hypothetical protein
MKNILTTMALLASGLSAPAPSQAGVTIAIGFGHNNYQRMHREAFQNGFENGTRDGEQNGIEDARRHRDFDMTRHGDFRSAMRDSNCRSVSRRAFAAGYREGFEQAYQSAFFAHNRCNSRRLGRCDDNDHWDNRLGQREPDWSDRRHNR